MKHVLSKIYLPSCSVTVYHLETKFCISFRKNNPLVFSSAHHISINISSDITTSFCTGELCLHFSFRDLVFVGEASFFQIDTATKPTTVTLVFLPLF